MLDSTPDLFVIGRILTLHSALHASTDEEQRAQVVCRGLRRIPGVEDCAVCAGGTVIASSSPGETRDLAAQLCAEELRAEGCRGTCQSRRFHRMARVALATPRRSYGGLLIRISDEDQYSTYEPHIEDVAGRIALHMEIDRQAAELRDQRASVAGQVRARTAEIEDGKVRLELAVRGGGLGAWDWNVNSGAVSYSEGCASLLGYKVNEIEPTVRSWDRLVHPGDLAAMTEAMKAHLDGKTPSYESEHRRRHASGEWIWILDRGQVVEWDAAGRPLRMCGTHLDITERKRAERAQQLSEERLRLALDAGGMGTWDVDLETGRAAWSDSHYRLFGVAPGQFDGTMEGFKRLVHPDDLAGLLAEVDRCRQERRRFQYSFRIVWPDGSVHWMSTQGTVSLDAQGNPVRLLGVTWDTTERHLADAERQRLSAAIEHAGESFAIVARGGNVVYVNPAFERTSGYPAQEIVGQRWSLLESEKIDAASRAAAWDTLLAGKAWSGRSAIKRKDGAAIAIQCTVSPVRSKGGEVDYMVAIYRDITDQLRMEEECRQAQKIESIGRLAAGVAHDFNNMLTPILGYAEMLLAGLHPADARYGQLLEIKKAAECSRDLTRQLVAFSRKQALQLKDVDLREVVGGLERLLRRTLRRNIELKTSLGETPCPVAVDVGQIEQVLMNLAVTAQEAMPDGGELSIEVKPAELDAAFCAAHHGARPGRYGALMVADTGRGMDEETRQHAFEPFFSKKDDPPGGLGLSTVYGVVRQHAGSIWIESEPGKGTRFSIYLPAALPPPAEGQPPSRQANRESATILLVEDNEMVRKLTQSLLQMQGYTVRCSASGQEAIAAAGEGPEAVDLLLAGAAMPDMSGRELAAKLREKWPKLKVLFMSGYTDDADDQPGALEAGTDIIQKPFSVGGLAAKLRDVLDREG
jgi:PAS domain S-box-containing protein